MEGQKRGLSDPNVEVKVGIITIGSNPAERKDGGNIHIYVNMHMQAWICAYVCA